MYIEEMYSSLEVKSETQTKKKSSSIKNKPICFLSSYVSWLLIFYEKITELIGYMY